MARPSIDRAARDALRDMRRQGLPQREVARLAGRSKESARLLTRGAVVAGRGLAPLPAPIEQPWRWGR